MFCKYLWHIRGKFEFKINAFGLYMTETWNLKTCILTITKKYLSLKIIIVIKPCS